MAEAAFAGGCRCGAVRWRARISPFRSVLCHCAGCRRATGAPVSGYLGFAKLAVGWAGQRAFRSPARGVTRGACAVCGVSLSYMCTRWPGELYLHAASLDDPSVFAPQAHLHWAARLPGAAADDDLPRHPGRGPDDLPPAAARTR